LLLGGAAGNLVDRFFRAPGPLRGHVVDFLSVGWLPVFNLADAAVLGGAGCLIVLALFAPGLGDPRQGSSVNPG
jgi:signal peptidase II